MANTNKIELSEFTRRAAQRLEDKKRPVKFQVYVPEMDMEMTFRSLLDSEITEAMDRAGEDAVRGDKYAIYMAAVEPDLKKVAKELKEAGKITVYEEVVDMFTMSERTRLAQLIMQKSGALTDNPVSLVEKATSTIKN